MAIKSYDSEGAGGGYFEGSIQKKIKDQMNAAFQQSELERLNKQEGNAAKAIEALQSGASLSEQKANSEPIPLGLRGEFGSMKGTIGDPAFRAANYADNISKQQSTLERIQAEKESLIGKQSPVEPIEPAPIEQEIAQPVYTPLAQQAPKADSQYPDSLKMVERGYGKEAEVAGDLGKFQARQMQSALDETERLAQERQKRFEQEQSLYDTYLKQKEEDYKNLKELEPKDFWADKSTGTKITAAILLGLGALGGAMAKGPNQVQARLDKIVDDDLSKQKLRRQNFKEGMGLKDSIFDMNMKKFGNAELAEQATKQDMYKMLDMKIEQMKARQADPLAKASLDKIRGNLRYQHDQSVAKTASEFAKLTAEQLEKQKEFNLKEREYFVPSMGAQATSKEGATELRKMGARIGSAVSSIDQMLAIVTKGGKSMDLDLRAKAQVLKGMMTGDIKDQVIGTGAISEGEWKLLDKVIADPTNFFSMDASNKVRLNTLKAKLLEGLKLRAASEGISTAGQENEKSAAQKRLQATQINRKPEGEFDDVSTTTMRKMNPNLRDNENQLSSMAYQKSRYEKQQDESDAQEVDYAVKRMYELNIPKKGQAVDKEWLKAAQNTSKNLGIQFRDLLSVVGAESRFDPAAKNPRSSASGLIQIMRKNAEDLGTTPEKIVKMDGYKQLQLIEDYIKPKFDAKRKQYPNWKPTRSDVYAAIAAPKYIAKPDSSVMYDKKSNSKAYSLNKNWDRNSDGKITKGEASEFVTSSADF